MRAEICLDWEKLDVKPSKPYIGKIANRIATQPVEMNIDEMAACIANGQSFTTAVFMGDKRKKSDVLRMQLFALDFDRAEDYGYDYQNIRKKFEEFHLPISFAYHSLRSRPDYPKFRIVLCHIVPISEPRLIDLIIHILIELFPEADRACSDSSRLFLGGKGLIECDANACFRVDMLVDTFQRYESKHDPHNYTAIINRVAKKGGIAVYNKRYFS